MIHDRYDRLTARERVLATVAALAREDQTEAERLLRSTPEYSYKNIPDAEVTRLFVGTLFLAQRFLIEWNLAFTAYTFGTLGCARKKKRARGKEETLEELEDCVFMRIQGLLRAWGGFCREYALPGNDILRVHIGPAFRLAEPFLANGWALKDAGEREGELREIERDIGRTFRVCWPEALDRGEADGVDKDGGENGERMPEKRQTAAEGGG